MAAISEYDQELAEVEEEHVNRLEESLNVFANILRNQFFISTNVVLFLNKKDLLEEKIKSGRNLVTDYYPDCPGNDYESAKDYFQECFMEQNPNPDVRKIFPHVTCATDRENIKMIDSAVQYVIMKIILGDIGFH